MPIPRPLRLADPRLAALALAALLVSVPAPARSATLTLDPAATAIEFTLGATMHQIDGSLRLRSGAIEFDPASGRARGEIVLDALSAETGNPKRDRKMHEGVLETASYPDWIFRPLSVQGQFLAEGESHLRLQGSLSIHGAEHAVEIPAVITSHGGALQGEATLEIPYVDWGMKDPSVFVLRVAKIVEVKLHLEGSLSQEAPAVAASPAPAGGASR